jgi:hypothetical protein
LGRVMSDNWLILIPADPNYVPDSQSQQRARDLFESFLPNAEEININLTDGIRFVDQGSNFESVSCPKCGTKVDIDWWQRAMNTACGVAPDVDWWDWGLVLDSDPVFTDLMITIPCCGSDLSLNDLVYYWPAGFARFGLEALYPDGNLSDEQIALLKQTLDCDLRVIWSHY